MIYVAVVIALILWIAFYPLYPLTWFGRLWGYEVFPIWPLGDDLLSKLSRALEASGIPSSHRRADGIQCRVSHRFTKIATWCGHRIGTVPKDESVVAITLGRTIIVCSMYKIDAPLLKHELKHVEQWERFWGWYAWSAAAEAEAERAEAA